MFDEKQYKDFQNKIDNSKLYRWFWIFWGNYAFIVFALVAVYIIITPDLLNNWKDVLGLSILSFVLTRGLAVALINQFVKRQRPYQKYKTKPEETKFFSFRDKVFDSFPSRHTAAYFSVATVVFLFYPTLGGVLLVVSVMAGIGRVIMGWHWPSDIVAGIILGSGIAYLTVKYASSLFFTLT